MVFQVSATDLQTESVLARIYYPHAKSKSASPAVNCPWLPKTSFYTKGLIRFLNLSFFTYPILYLTLHFTKSIVPLTSAPISGEHSNFPVIIFSHGLGGMRSTYSHLCHRYASRGFIVFAIEHKDGSACASYHPTTPLPHVFPKKEEVKVGQTNAEYLLEFRRQQCHYKVRETNEMVKVIHNLNSIGIDGLSLMECKGIDMRREILVQFKGKLDVENISLMGHSFGGASVLSALQNKENPFRAGIVYDPWMYSVPPNIPSTKPLLSIQSATFHWKENLEQLLKHFEELSHKDESRLLVITESAHEDFSDFPLYFPGIMKCMKLRGTRDPSETMELWTNATLEFLRIHANHPAVEFPDTSSYHLSGESEGVLSGKDARDFLEKNVKATWK